ncbi:SUF system Fe-S cluster assembly regulator [Qipengyuania sp. S6317L1]|uniref:SUF system Fe-S cluster assembly regulator n=1 Tax=Qipengyuania sp. S6317L1 TaxID=2926410 RepID=UPI001FF38651|nr:SUF system Fe-S cluster assembly regulator [Qipengyuania sp. S6317L1]MCK0099015.1 SUF system Fe-S cluster assembly regulator [Qipengyuania sp. S6317L1]
MRLSNLTDYAIITMCQAAAHCGDGRVSAAELAHESGLPVPTVQRLVSKLTRAHLLRSVRGVNGGLQLGRPAAAITVADIVEAVEGPIALTACADHGDCDYEAGCNMKPHWPLINSKLRGALAEISLADLRQEPAAEPSQTNSQEELTV